MKHDYTPGDWCAEHLDPYWAIIGDGIENVGFIRDEADAMLVVAAPKLFTALRQMVEADASNNIFMKEQAMQTALNALALAEAGRE